MIDAELGEDGGIGRRAVLLQVDAVVNHPDSLRRDTVERLHVLSHRGRHGNDAVRVLVRGALDPGGRVIRRPELFCFPGAVRLERVRRQHERDVLQHLHEAARKVRIPRVTVHDVRVGQCAAHQQVLQQRGKQLRVSRILRRQSHWRLDARDRQVLQALPLIAERQDLDVVAPLVQGGELAREVLDVDARAAVHVRRVLVGQDGDVHDAPG